MTTNNAYDDVDRSTDPVSTRAQVDPRGPRFAGAVTSVVLAAGLLRVGTTAGTLIVAWQTLAFALGALVGVQAQPYGIVFRRLVRPRLHPPTELEDAAPPRFAQGVGLAFLVVALLASVVGVTAVATAAIALALAAAFLNAVFGICLGCELYLVGRRLLTR